MLILAETTKAAILPFKRANRVPNRIGTADENFDGLIDEVRISNVARQPANMIAFANQDAPVIVTQPSGKYVDA